MDKRKPERNNLHPHDQESPPPNNPWLKKKIVKPDNNFEYEWIHVKKYSLVFWTEEVLQVLANRGRCGKHHIHDITWNGRYFVF